MADPDLQAVLVVCCWWLPSGKAMPLGVPRRVGMAADLDLPCARRARPGRSRRRLVYAASRRSAAAVSAPGADSWSRGWLAGRSFGVGRRPGGRSPWVPPDEYDLTKWAYVNYFRGSTGYYQVAKKQAAATPGDSWPSIPTGSGPRTLPHRHPPARFDRRPVCLAAGDGAKPGTVAFCSPDHAGLDRRGFPAVRQMDRQADPAGRSGDSLPATACSRCWRGRDGRSALLAGALALPASGGLGRGGTLAACASAATCFSRSPNGLSFALDLGLGPGGLGRRAQAGRGRPARLLGGCCRDRHGLRHVFHAGVPACRSDRGA